MKVLIVLFALAACQVYGQDTKSLTGLESQLTNEVWLISHEIFTAASNLSMTASMVLSDLTNNAITSFRTIADRSTTKTNATLYNNAVEQAGQNQGILMIRRFEMLKNEDFFNSFVTVAVSEARAAVLEGASPEKASEDATAIFRKRVAYFKKTALALYEESRIDLEQVRNRVSYLNEFIAYAAKKGPAPLVNPSQANRDIAATYSYALSYHSEKQIQLHPISQFSTRTSF
jgi:hypothetical protein